MAISRAQLAKELEPGLNALFGLSYDFYPNQYEAIFAIEDSERAFEEEVLISGFGSAPVKRKELVLHLTRRRKVSLPVIRTIRLLWHLVLPLKQLRTTCTTPWDVVIRRRLRIQWRTPRKLRVQTY